MKTPRNPPVPADERAFGFLAQVPCQGGARTQVLSRAHHRLARDVRLTDKLACRRGLQVGRISHAVKHGAREFSLEEIGAVGLALMWG